MESVSAVPATGVIAAKDEGLATKVTTLLAIGFLFSSSTVAEALTGLPRVSEFVVAPEFPSESTRLTEGFGFWAGVMVPEPLLELLLLPPPPPPPQPVMSNTAEARAAPSAVLRVHAFIFTFPVLLSKELVRIGNASPEGNMSLDCTGGVRQEQAGQRILQWPGFSSCAIGALQAAAAKSA